MYLQNTDQRVLKRAQEITLNEIGILKIDWFGLQRNFRNIPMRINVHLSCHVKVILHIHVVIILLIKAVIRGGYRISEWGRGRVIKMRHIHAHSLNMFSLVMKSGGPSIGETGYVPPPTPPPPRIRPW